MQDNFDELQDYFLQFRCYGKNGVMGDLSLLPIPAMSLVL